MKIESFPAANCRVLEDIDTLIDTDLRKSQLGGSDGCHVVRYYLLPFGNPRVTVLGFVNEGLHAFSELKEEENERLHSRKELTSTRMIFREQSAWSHNVKRMKSTSVLGATFEDSAVFKQYN
ncbi:Uncharacterized protein Fot_33573 [Forsythia ovata]|uniref:Uncharacterized protein n=1 Tax=Forsythia ovata TaxID=205694 RepID=A0ABD1TB10_9LAMI